MLLSTELLVWERYLDGHSLLARVTLWIWRKVVLLIPVWVVLAVARVALSKSLPDFLASLCGLLPQYSAGTAALLVAARTDRLATLVRHVRFLAEDMERGADDDSEPRQPQLQLQEMGRCAVLVRSARRAVAVYMPTGMSLLVAQQVLGDPPAPTIGDESALTYPAAHALLTVNETVKWAFYATSYFVLWALLASVLLALSGMYAALVRRFAADGHVSAGAGVRGSAEQHLRLLALQTELKDLTFQPMLHVLAGAGVVPLINTYQLLGGVANVFSFLTFSTLPVVFGSLSALGDGLEVWSEQVSLEAFWGVDVFGEPLADSKVRLMLVARASGHQGRPSGFSMRGFGSLNHRAAFNALHRWYQYLQLLMGSAN